MDLGSGKSPKLAEIVGLWPSCLVGADLSLGRFFGFEKANRGRALDWNSRQMMWIWKGWPKHLSSARKVFFFLSIGGCFCWTSVFCLVKFSFIIPYDIVASRFMLQTFEDSTSMVVHERTMLIFGGHDSSQVNEFNDPMGGMTVLIDRELGQETLMISYFILHKTETLKNGPPPFHHPSFFCFASMLILHMLPPILLETAICCLEKNQAMRPKRMHCWCVWIGMVHWKPPNIVVMSHLERHHGVGHAGISYSCTKQTKKKAAAQDSRHEVRGVCFWWFWWFVLVFFFDFPSSIDKCWPQWKIKIHCLFFWSSPALLMKTSWYNFLLPRPTVKRFDLRCVLACKSHRPPTAPWWPWGRTSFVAVLMQQAKLPSFLGGHFFGFFLASRVSLHHPQPTNIRIFRDETGLPVLDLKMNQLDTPFGPT